MFAHDLSGVPSMGYHIAIFLNVHRAAASLEMVSLACCLIVVRIVDDGRIARRLRIGLIVASRVDAGGASDPP